MKVNIETCIGCGVCVRVCKYSVFGLECKTEMGLNICYCVASHQEDCTNCGRCIDECLAGAIAA
jgi:NAD-dependent dihydropyrimidine dehydrogenase PreA subunit